MNSMRELFKSSLIALSVLLQFVMPSSLSAKEYKYDLAVCAIFQNEAPYLREWIEFHKLVGVKHFYLFNNLSSDHCKKVLKPYIKSGEVELFDWDYHTCANGSNWPTIQLMAYIHGINLAKNQAKWLAIIDVDEFLFPVETKNLANLLLNYEDAAAVCVNWQMYGTSGVKKIHHDELLIEKLIYKAPTLYHENVNVKSIVRPEFVETMGNPHCCALLPGYYQVNANKEPFGGLTTAVKIDKIRINHYWTRDENFFHKVKIPRRQKWQDSGSIDRANLLNSEKDTAIFKYIPKLKKALDIKK